MSYNIQRKQLQSPLSASYAETASYALTFTETDPIFVAKSASLATTGSNIFIGNQTITGSILMSGSSADAYISTVNWIDFNTNIPAGSPTFASGRLHWVSDTQTLGLDTDVNGSSIELGHQHVVRVNNQTGTLLTVGTIVYINGSQGTRPTVATASYTDENDSATTLGFVMHDIAGTGGNRNGYIVTKGILRGVNTIGMPAGTSLYLSSSGKYSTSKPQAPLHDVRLGKVVYQGNNATDGVIYVDIQNGYEIEELHDVRIINASNGDLLTRSGSLWINTKQLSGFYGLTGSLSFRNGGVTGSLFGTASWATNAITSSVVSVASTSTAGTYYLHFGNQNSGVDNIEVDTGLTYNPSTNELSTTTFIGDLNGNASTSTTAGAAASAGNADNVTVNAFNAVDANTTHYFILENGVEGAASSEQLFENPLFSYLKLNNSYLFDDTEDKTAPKITIGAQDSLDKADVLVYGNVTATGIISAPNLSTGINTLNFVGDYTRPEETVSASFSVTDGRLLVSSASLSASFIGNLTGTASYATNALTASYLSTYIPPFPFTGSAVITGSLTVTGSTFISSSNATQFQVGSNLLFISSSGNVGIGTITPSASLHIKGSGITSGTNTLRVENSNASASLVIRDDGRVSINNASFTEQFNVEGNIRCTNSFIVPNNGNYFSSGVSNIVYVRSTETTTNGFVTLWSTSNLVATTGNQIEFGIGRSSFQPGSGVATYTSQLINITINQTGGANGITRGIHINPTLTSAADWRSLEWTNNTGFGLYGSGSASNVLRGNTTIGSLITGSSTFNVAGTTRLSGSFNTATSGSILTVIGSGSAQPIFTVQGSQGELFSVTDSLSGSLFSVNDISGLPIMEVFSDNTVVMGNYLDPMLITTVYTASVGIGSHILYRLPTSSYDGFWFEYTARSGSNARAGQMMGIWSGSSVNYTETTTTDFGSTTAVQLMSTISSGNMIITGSTTTAGWTIKGIIRSI